MCVYICIRSNDECDNGDDEGHDSMLSSSSCEFLYEKENEEFFYTSSLKGTGTNIEVRMYVK